MHIVLDAFGSDHAPLPEVEGAILAIKENLCEKVFLVGHQSTLKKELDRFFYDSNRIEIVHAPDVISMDASPAKMVKQKKESSLVKAVQIHSEGKASAVVSAGNTGAMMAASLFSLGRIKNVLRPAIATTFPTMKHPEIILDVGANADCTVDHLIQFAIMGSLYTKYFFKNDQPKVALLNIGEESTKGNLLYKSVHHALSSHKNIHFVGNIEGKELLSGIVDVVVCDGFVGNIMLKTVEGVAVSIFKMMKDQITKDWIAKIGALLSFPVYTYLKKKLDHTEYGGALLIGVNGIPIIAHGSSNAKAIKNAIKVASKIAQSGFVDKTREFFEKETL